MTADLETQQAAYKQTLTKMKVPLYGNLRVEGKEEEVVRVLGLNINSLSFWQKENYRAERLKFIFEKYGVNSVGLQEVCINWSDFKASQTLSSLLRAKAENICSVASHNKQETNSIGRYQKGGTAIIVG